MKNIEKIYVKSEEEIADLGSALSFFGFNPNDDEDIKKIFDAIQLHTEIKQFKIYIITKELLKKLFNIEYNEEYIICIDLNDLTDISFLVESLKIYEIGGDYLDCLIAKLLDN